MRNTANDRPAGSDRSRWDHCCRPPRNALPRAHPMATISRRAIPSAAGCTKTREAGSFPAGTSGRTRASERERAGPESIPGRPFPERPCSGAQNNSPIREIKSVAMNGRFSPPNGSSGPEPTSARPAEPPNAKSLPKKALPPRRGQRRAGNRSPPRGKSASREGTGVKTMNVGGTRTPVLMHRHRAPQAHGDLRGQPRRRTERTLGFRQKTTRCVAVGGRRFNALGFFVPGRLRGLARTESVRAADPCGAETTLPYGTRSKASP